MSLGCHSVKNPGACPGTREAEAPEMPNALVENSTGLVTEGAAPSEIRRSRLSPTAHSSTCICLALTLPPGFDHLTHRRTEAQRTH